MTDAQPKDHRIERQAAESKVDLSAAVAELCGKCPACFGTGKVRARIQFTDRRKPCIEEDRPCPVCQK